MMRRPIIRFLYVNGVQFKPSGNMPFFRKVRNAAVIYFFVIEGGSTRFLVFDYITNEFMDIAPAGFSVFDYVGIEMGAQVPDPYYREEARIENKNILRIEYTAGKKHSLTVVDLSKKMVTRYERTD